MASNQVVTEAGNPATLSQPDDIATLGGDLFVAYQNGVGPSGEPSPSGTTYSTVVDYRHGQRAVASWDLTGKVDGLVGDGRTHQLVATVDEDSNTSLYTIDPEALPIDQVVHYEYDPANPLPHGGGTDALSVYQGRLLVSASAPGTVPGSGTTPATMPAVYTAVLDHHPGQDTGTASLAPLFYDGSPATVANTTAPMPSPLSPNPASYGTVPSLGTEVTLHLSDPDSNGIVAASSPRFGGDFVLDSQGDEQLVFLDGDRGGRPEPALHGLDLSQTVNDLAFVTNSGGTLYVDDPSRDQVLAITGPMKGGEVLVAATPADADNPVSAPNYLATLDMSDGTVSAIPALAGIQPAGMQLVSR
ncbi:MAG: hypothetical protein ACRDY0_08905 [Acidimicrobiales bacterium]